MGPSSPKYVLSNFISARATTKSDPGSGSTRSFNLFSHVGGDTFALKRLNVKNEKHKHLYNEKKLQVMTRRNILI